MRTVKVRVACAVDPKGNWYAIGYNNAEDERIQADCVETLDTGEAHYWLEVELPIPEAKSITVTGFITVAEPPK